jgi:hypothetical protein
MKERQSKQPLSPRQAIHMAMPRLHSVRVDMSKDIPYLAGYSKNEHTVYIDRLMPKMFKGHHIAKYLLVHEVVEKTLIDKLGYDYEHAHKIATQCEKLAVEADGLDWGEYEHHCDAYIKQAEHETPRCTPIDLDLKPYTDEHDTATLKKIHTAQAGCGGVWSFDLDATC